MPKKPATESKKDVPAASGFKNGESLTNLLNTAVPPPPSPSRRRQSLRRSNSISRRRRSKSRVNLYANSTEALPLEPQPVAPKPKAKKRPEPKKVDIDALSIYKHPWTILKGFFGYSIYKVNQTTSKTVKNLHRVLIGISIMALLLGFIYTSEHPVRWYLSWVLLGILSSVGLGTGLHTFIMFLGPHIAQVTTAAYSCGHLDFTADTWEKVHCTPLAKPLAITLLQVASLVKWESFLWGVGTALGELPPYFVAKAARDAEASRSLDPLKSRVAKWIRKFGFWGILAFASVPNPLFDLAGIICGSCGIPISTFFSATMLGKAVIKTSLQVMFVVALFSPSSRKIFLDFLSAFFPRFHGVFQTWLQKEMRKYFHSHHDGLAESSNWINLLWNGFIFLMLMFFILSIVESLAKRHFKRQKSA